MDAEILRQIRVRMTSCLAVILLSVVGGCFFFVIPPSPPSDRKFTRLFQEQRQNFLALRDAGVQFTGPDYWLYEREPAWAGLVEAANDFGLSPQMFFHREDETGEFVLMITFWSVRDVGAKSIVWDPDYDGRIHRSTDLWWRGDTVEARARLEEDWWISRYWD